MDRKKSFIRLALVVFFIFLLNFIGSKLHWYYSVWYYDIVMHTLGGLWIALVIFWLYPVKIKNEFTKHIFFVLLGVLMIGILWEFFEIFVNETIAKNPFNFFDTISDIFCDLTGGVLVLIYFYKNIFLKEENKL